LLHKIFFLGFIYAGLRANLGLVGVVASHLISSIALSVFYRVIVVRKYVHPRLRLDYQMWKYLLTSSVPIGGATIVRLLALQIDVIILTWMADMGTVGLFSGPYRLTMALRFVPMMVSVTLYPMFARVARSPGSIADFQEIYERSFKLFVISGFAVAAAFVAASDIAVALLLGARYQSSVRTMQLLGAGFIPFFAASPFPFLFAAANRQRFLFKSAAAALLARIGLDFLLIRYSPLLGPSW
jgi:O-antigen/teichoic acid export membrane protein